MKTRMIQMAAWVNTDPRRAKAISVGVLVALAILASAVPGAHVLAGPIGGGGDVGGL